MASQNELISYALDFAAYIISQTAGINRIILFGSVARGDFDQESDIDLFIDTKNKKLEIKMPQIIDSYTHTVKAKSWRLKGVTNDFSCKVGELDSKLWTDLKRAMLTHGIVLYGAYQERAEKVFQYSLFLFDKIKPESKRVSLHRTLFGFRTGSKKYSGLMSKYQFMKIGKGSILVSRQHTLQLKQLFKEKKVSVKIYEIWSDDSFF